MKVAIVHDALTKVWGAERVVAQMARIFSRAHIYSSYANDSTIKQLNLTGHKIITSKIQKALFISGRNSVLQMLSPLIWNSFNFEKYDLVISSSGFALSNTITTVKIPHIQYIHTPPKNIFLQTPRWTLQNIVPYHLLLSRKYRKAIKNNSFIISNSQHMQKTLKKMFDVNSTVIYPPVAIPSQRPKLNSDEYFITVGRLDPEKSVDLSIKACNQLKLPLKIVGSGPSLDYLKKIAGPTIEFLGFIPDDKLEKIYLKAKCFLFCAQNEDFGIAPLEALAHGVPVISYFGGGPIETLIDHKTGLFFHKHTVRSLISSIKKFDLDDYDPNFLYQHAKKFSGERFRKELKKYTSKLLNQGYTDKL